MEGDDVAEMDLGDPAVGSDMFQNVSEHHAVVVPGLGGFARQVLPSIAFGQIRHGWGLTPLAPVAGRVFTPVDSLPDLLGLGTGGYNAPIWPGADAIPTLGAIDPVGQQERSYASRTGLARRKYPQRKAGQFGIPDQPGATRGRLQSLNEGLGQAFGHGPRFPEKPTRRPTAADS